MYCSSNPTKNLDPLGLLDKEVHKAIPALFEIINYNLNGINAMNMLGDMMLDLEALSRTIKCGHIKNAYVCWKGKHIPQRWTMKVGLGVMLIDPDEWTCLYGTLVGKGGIGCQSCDEEKGEQAILEKSKLEEKAAMLVAKWQYEQLTKRGRIDYGKHETRNAF